MALQGTKDSLLGDLLKILLAVILPRLLLWSFNNLNIFDGELLNMRRQMDLLFLLLNDGTPVVLFVRFLALLKNHGVCNFAFFDILVHRDARARAPARVVPNPRVLVHRDARARVVPDPGVLVHHDARASARVIANLGARRL